jgi:hypothetical protein
MKVCALTIIFSLVLLGLADAQGRKLPQPRAGVDALGVPLIPAGPASKTTANIQAWYVLVMPRLRMLLEHPREIESPNPRQWMQLAGPMALEACNQLLNQPQSITLNGDSEEPSREINVTSVRKCVPYQVMASGGAQSR